MTFRGYENIFPSKVTILMTVPVFLLVIFDNSTMNSKLTVILGCASAHLLVRFLSRNPKNWSLGVCSFVIFIFCCMIPHMYMYICWIFFRAYVRDAFMTCKTPSDKDKMEQLLKSKLSYVFNSGLVNTIDWSKESYPNL